MVYSQVGYCACGQEIWIEYLRDGEFWFCLFIGADHREIDRCPGCGAVIEEDALESL